MSRGGNVARQGKRPARLLRDHSSRCRDANVRIASRSAEVSTSVRCCMTRSTTGGPRGKSRPARAGTLRVYNVPGGTASPDGRPTCSHWLGVALGGATDRTRTGGRQVGKPCREEAAVGGAWVGLPVRRRAGRPRWPPNGEHRLQPHQIKRAQRSCFSAAVSCMRR